MITVMEQPMAAKRGRPMKSDGSGDVNSRQVRLPNDLADKIGWIVRIRKHTESGFTVAQLIEPMIRPGVNLQYAKIESQVEKIKKTEREASMKSQPDKA